MADGGKLFTGIGGGVCGVYSITTPTGKVYIGSSIDVRRRWYEHHWRMKNGKSSSPQLDRAFAKYRLQLEFKVLEECPEKELREREQWYIDTIKPELNASKDAYCAVLWAAKLGGKLSSGREARRCQVEDSSGRIYQSISAAAEAIGCSDTALRRRMKHHDPLPCGLRLKRHGEEWKPIRPSADERKRATMAETVKQRRKSGGPIHSEEARREKSERTRGVPWSKERRERFNAKRGAA